MSIRRVYSIPAHFPFVEALAHGIITETGGDPVALARYQILLPTRRSCRSLREAFLRLGDGRPTLLPRMTPIGDVDEDELVLADDLPGSPGAAVLDLPPAVPALRRQLILMRLIRSRDADQSPDQAALLARELANLMDQVATERLNFADLAQLDVGSFADHWQQTLEFLKLVTEHWPAILAAEGAIDPAERRNRLLEAQAARWRDTPPDTPIIAAGSTGSIPATADLLATVCTLPHGAVVLPGLDMYLDSASWDAIGPTHPQFGLKHLLGHLDVPRAEVEPWYGYDTKAAPESRTTLLRHALLPAPSTGTPVSGDIISADALEGVKRVDCPDPGKEAEAIAIAIREALETPGKTVGLVTPDRNLARRVASELSRWGLEVDDSAGIPLDQTPPGAFLRLSAAMIGGNFAPVPLLAALKHPLAACGENPAVCRARVRSLEILALRGVRPGPGIAGLRAALDQRTETAPLMAFLDRLEEILSPMIMPAETVGAETPFATLLKAHVGVSEALCASEQMSGAERLWRGDAGEALATFVADLQDSLDDRITISGMDYGALLDTLMIGRVVRPRHNLHPRVHIWGTMEARLQHADTLILGGLNEGTWPPEPPSSPWMSRPMMTAFGLPLPERRIGLSAHDFAQAFAAPNVILTRADRVDGTPTVASRWLRRMENIVATSDHADLFVPDREALSMAMALDRPKESVAPRPPEPRPPVAARPRRMSVTKVRDLQRDPYAIYARQILGLDPLDPIDADPGAADRGIIIHRVLERFVETYPENLPDNAEAELIRLGHEVFGDHLTSPGIRAFWWPRFLRIAEWFVANEAARREAGDRPVLIEQKGEVSFPAPGGKFTLSAKADRMDQIATGELGIIDYKTGEPPSAAQAKAGLEPQLPLEAAMVKQGGFDNLPTTEVRRLSYIKVNGGREPGRVSHLKLDVEDTANEAWAGFQKLIAEFDQPEMPYLSHTRPMKQREQGDFDHLARVREWLSAEEDQ